MYNVSYTQIDKLEPLIESAKKFEAALHQKSRDIKSANWLLNMAKDADLELDDELRQELIDKTGLSTAHIDYHKKGKKKQKKGEDGEEEEEEGEKVEKTGGEAKHKTKAS
jgi:hypothetical protein